MQLKKVDYPIFWEEDEKGKPKISNIGLLGFLERNGFAMAKVSETDQILVKMFNNRMSRVDETLVDQIIQEHLVSCGQDKILETYAKGMAGYFTKRKSNLLPQIELVKDRDKSESSNFYFPNCYGKITDKEIKVLGYDSLEMPIWENRILKQEYVHMNEPGAGQFEQFSKNITGNQDERLLALKTILGYLLHRNKEVGESKAIIFYDENMCLNNQAHGGTGKTLLSQAISKCREVEIFDGKEIKTGSWFKNQRIELTTDVLVYDDLNQYVSLENFYAMITSGIEVEKKRQQSYFIKHEDSPKILITSNYPVKGPGGSSDVRRRHEFELSNYYDANFTPEMEFGNRFFGNAWNQEEWSRFFYFMMSCVQDYLRHGLFEVEPINLKRAKLVDGSCQEFVEFANEFVEFNEWQDKRVFETLFQESHPEVEVRSPHIFKKWLCSFAIENSASFDQKSSGGNYLFRIKKEVKDV
ncbi:hypothetical protein H4O18_05075 [Arenibacter sp. BSSL-BM3]|uniref:Uncharacterized protein n=1 Tax=Arenibacter arenosicollis TaxID=2762274 RepID=A0ABR7QJK4_9FLAO|nr:primase-helicase family protein [Arenibacter arenosicollis]MBC8767358.1 hypothetical protein [Arenibacter arenosicollis]